MLSRRDKLLVAPWEMQRYKNHKRKIKSAKPAIDISSPATHLHVTYKLKKLQAEKERLDNIKKDNIRLLQRLGDIMNSKRVKNFWQHPRPNFLNREKIFFNRPKTCQARVENQSETFSISPISSEIKSFSAARCSTCSGKRIKKNQVIPEERIPWEPLRKSWNVKFP